MKAFVLNLRRSTERRKNIVKELETHQVNYEIVEAIDGGAVPPEEMFAFADMEAVKRTPRWLTPRVLATSLSHRKVFKEIVDQGLNFGIVFEDDARLNENLNETVRAIQPNLIDGEIVMLHYGSPSKSPIILSSRNKFDLKVSSRSIHFPMKLEDLGSAAAYIVTAKAAKQLYDGLIPLSTSADSWVDFVTKGCVDRIRMVYPMPAAISGEKSTIAIDTQTNFRARVTEFIDKHRVPLIHSVIRNLKLWIINRQSVVRLVDEDSPFDN